VARRLESLRRRQQRESGSVGVGGFVVGGGGSISGGKGSSAAAAAPRSKETAEAECRAALLAVQAVERDLRQLRDAKRELDDCNEALRRGKNE
jgi:chromosome segregation ATPase